MRTSGLPPISASSLFGPPMRVERPAASTTAAMRCAFSGSRLGARLRPRHDFHQQAADAHAGDVLARHRQAGEQPHQHPVEAVFLRRARAARRAEHRLARAPAPISIRLPGSTGMPKCSISPPTASTAAGMTSRRSAMAEAPNTIDQLGARLAAPRRSPCASARLLVRHAALGDDRGAGRRQPLLGDLQRLLDHLGRKARQQRRDDADLADLVGRDADERLALRRRQRRLSRAASATANGMIFTVAIISPATTGLKAGSVANVIASSMRLSRSIGVLVDHQHAGALGEQIARPVKARSTCTPSPATAAAISAAASSSETSPGSSRATTISLMPAASQRRDLGRRRSACPS